MATSPAPRIPDLHKSAFWIYGVTAMVMREPLGIVLRHGSAAGWHDPAVQLEALRSLVVLGLMSRQFLSAGIYFDRIYLQPDSAGRYPLRNYPFDFLFGMGELLMAVGASALVGTAGPAFDVVAGLILLSESLWLLASRIFRYSTGPKIAPSAWFNLGTLVVWIPTAMLAGERLGYALLIVLTALHMIRLGRGYDKP